MSPSGQREEVGALSLARWQWHFGVAARCRGQRRFGVGGCGGCEPTSEAKELCAQEVFGPSGREENTISAVVARHGTEGQVRLTQSDTYHLVWWG